MRVFVAGATGAMGRQLVPLLVADGCEVIGIVRTGDRIDAVRAMGARAVVADALDAAPRIVAGRLQRRASLRAMIAFA